MVAAKNRMFRTATGRIITVQDAAKTGLIDPNDIPKDKEAAIAFRDKLVEQMSDKDKDKLLDAASDRVGYKINRDIKQEIKSSKSKEKKSPYSDDKFQLNKRILRKTDQLKEGDFVFDNERYYVIREFNPYGKKGDGFSLYQQGITAAKRRAYIDSADPQPIKRLRGLMERFDNDTRIF